MTQLAYTRPHGGGGTSLNARFIDWIWHVRGTVPLGAVRSPDEAFERLDPFFRETGTSFERSGETLTFRKKGQAAQDKMSVFDRGVLRIEDGATGPVLRYRLTSHALLYCFLAPLLFLAIARFTIFIGDLEAASEKAAGAQKAQKKDEDPAEKYAKVPMSAIDKFLGAPAPEKPDKAKNDKDKEKGGRKRSPTPAYVFAGLFATLYVVGRVLEDRLIRMRFRKKLLGQ